MGSIIKKLDENQKQYLWQYLHLEDADPKNFKVQG